MSDRMKEKATEEDLGQRCHDSRGGVGDSFCFIWVLRVGTRLGQNDRSEGGESGSSGLGVHIGCEMFVRVDSTYSNRFSVRNLQTLILCLWRDLHLRLLGTRGIVTYDPVLFRVPLLSPVEFSLSISVRNGQSVKTETGVTEPTRCAEGYYFIDIPLVKSFNLTITKVVDNFLRKTLSRFCP